MLKNEEGKANGNQNESHDKSSLKKLFFADMADLFAKLED